MADTGAPEMWSRAARIESFTKPQKKQKKRASTQSKKTVTAQWPHETPTAEQLARAGFYFHFANDQDIDSTRCFSCGLKLDGWEPDDDPVKEHNAHTRDAERCVWATCLSVLRKEGEEPEGRDPLCEELLSARKETFGDRWPHEGKRGWKCKVDRMAEAGWSFDPSPQDTDGVTCHYCGLELSGFEPKDEPFEEHRRRTPSCRFFELIDFYHDGKLPKRKRAKASKSRSSVASKASRASVRSVMSTAISEDMDIDDGGTDVLGNDDVENMPSNLRPEEPKPKAKRATKAKSAAKTSKPRKKATSQAAETSDMEDDHERGEEPAQKKIKKSTKKNSKVAKPKTKETSFVEPRTSDVSAQLQAELEESVIEGSPNYWVNPDRDSMDSTHGVKRRSDGSIKDEQSEDDVFEFPLPPTSIPRQSDSKSKRVKTVTSSHIKHNLSQANESGKHKQLSFDSLPVRDEEEIDQELAQLEAEEKEKTRTKRGSKQPSTHSQQHKLSGAARSNIQTQHKPSDVIQVLQDEVDAETIAVALSNKGAIPEKHVSNTALTPSPSGSDKENDPSSLDSAVSKPANKLVYTSPVKSTRIPLAQSTPNRPSPMRNHSHLSPSKRQLGTITSSVPWAAIDIDTVLLSPSQHTPGKLSEQLADAAGVISQAERNMTVEGWIKWRADLGEDELKRKCEEMVSIFEREGNRALECLHGLNITA